MKFTKLSLSQFRSIFPNNGIYYIENRDDYTPAVRFPEFDEAVIRERNKTAGIFFTPNLFNGRRLQYQVKQIMACHCDWDCAKEGEVDKKELLERKNDSWNNLLALDFVPSIIIVTKNGFQPLWLVNEEKNDVDTINQYRRINSGIMGASMELGGMGDGTIDLSRLLRFPTFMHNKNPNDLFEIGAYLMGDELKFYHKQDLEGLFLPYAKDEPEERWQKSVGWQDANDPFAEISTDEVALAALKTQYPEAILNKADARFYLEKDEHGRYKPSALFSARIRYGEEMIGSTGQYEGGNKVTFVAKFLAKTNKEAMLWIAQQFNIKLDERFHKIMLDEVKLEPIIEKKEYKLGGLDTGLWAFDGFGVYPGAYLIAANQKVGKSALAIMLADSLTSKNHKVAYFDTELGLEVWSRKLTASHVFYNTYFTAKYRLEDVSMLINTRRKDDYYQYIDIKEVNALLEAKKECLSYYETKDLVGEDGLLAWKKTIEYMKIEIEKGTKVFILDNATSYATVNGDGKDEWQVLNEIYQYIVNFARTNNVYVFVLMHLNKGNEELIQLNTAKDAITKDDPDLFLDSTPPIKTRPTLDEIKGGSASLSQFTATIMLWRPYLDFDINKYGWRFCYNSRILIQSARYGSSMDKKCFFLPENNYFYPVEFKRG